MSAQRRFDPDRRARILQATLDLIAEHGFAAITHRRVAATADVPLGSMTYHFANLEELLTEAFRLLAVRVSDEFAQHLQKASDQGEAIEAVVDLIVGQHRISARNMLLSYELYAYAARNPMQRMVMWEWMQKSRSALEQHFAPPAARMIDAMIEGLTIHRSIDPDPAKRNEVRTIINRLADIR